MYSNHNKNNDIIDANINVRIVDPTGVVIRKKMHSIVPYAICVLYMTMKDSQPT